MALLEADVALPVVKAFIEEVKQRALGEEVLKSLTPGQAFIGVIHEELTRVMGEAGRGLNLHAAPPVVVVMRVYAPAAGVRDSSPSAYTSSR